MKGQLFFALILLIGIIGLAAAYFTKMNGCIGYNGCKGGSPENVWTHVATVGGHDSSSSYPYTSGSSKIPVRAIDLSRLI